MDNFGSNTRVFAGVSSSQGTVTPQPINSTNTSQEVNLFFYKINQNQITTFQKIISDFDKRLFRINQKINLNYFIYHNKQFNNHCILYTRTSNSKKGFNTIYHYTQFQEYILRTRDVPNDGILKWNACS